MGFIDSLFPKSKDSTSTVYTFDDVRRFARPFIKNDIHEALAFGEMAESGSSSVLSVAFVVSDETFRSYVTLVDSRLINLMSPTVGARRMARRSAFAVKWGGFKPEYLSGFPEREPFSPEALNLYVLPPGWRMELNFKNRVHNLRCKLHEEQNPHFAAELLETRVVPT